MIFNPMVVGKRDTASLEEWVKAHASWSSEIPTGGSVTRKIELDSERHEEEFLVFGPNAYMLMTGGSGSVLMGAVSYSTIGTLGGANLTRQGYNMNQTLVALGDVTIKSSTAGIVFSIEMVGSTPPSLPDGAKYMVYQVKSSATIPQQQ